MADYEWYEAVIQLETLREPPTRRANPDSIKQYRKGTEEYPNILDTPDLVVQIGPTWKPSLWLYYKRKIE